MNSRILSLFAILFSISLSAQQADQVQRGQRGYIPPPTELAVGAISIDDTLVDIDEKMDSYQTEFSLDSFEKEVMKNMIVEFETGKMDLLSNENMPYKSKLEGIEKLKEGLSNELTIFLTTEEISRFGELHYASKQMKKEMKKEKKKKKKKKKKKNKDKKTTN